MHWHLIHLVLPVAKGEIDIKEDRFATLTKDSREYYLHNLQKS